MGEYTEKTLCRLSDEEVVEVAKSGNEAALNHLMARYRNLVYKISGSYFVNGGELEDIVQEGMIGLYKAVRSFDKKVDSSFGAFAATCIKRQIITAVKAATRKKHLPLNTYVSLSDKEAEQPPFAPEGEEPLSVILDKEYRHNISVKINRVLSKFELRVLFCYLDGMSYNEIAAIVEKDPKAIDNALYRIKKKLLFLLCKNND